MFKKWRLNRALTEVQEETGASLKGVAALEALAHLKQVIIPTSLIFYQGEPVVRQYFAVQDQTIDTKQRVLLLAASLVQKGQHSILQSLRTAALENNITPREADMDSVEEMGSIGKVDRSVFVLGDANMMTAQEIELGVTVQTLAHQFELDGKYTIFLAQRNPKRLLAIFACEYELRPGYAEVVTSLRKLGVESILLTGVKTRIAKGLGNRLSLTLIHSELREEEKERIIKSLVTQQPASAVLTISQLAPLSLPVLKIGIESEEDITIQNFADLPSLIESAKSHVL